MLGLMLDPLTAAVCSPAEIQEMFDRMFRAERRYLKGF
jgi:alpha-galactosidase